jgi:hypothetical protein
MNRMQYFCTYFDRNYLLRGLVLYRSLKDIGATFTLWALCLDDESFQAVVRLGWPGLVPIALADLEAHDPELAAVKPTRSVIEYYFTLTPALPAYLLVLHPEIEVISYLDADLKFYSNPESILTKLESGSILIIPHGFPERLKALESHGKYNVGMVCFRNDPSGQQCLQRWRLQCIEWCYDRVEDGRFADQAYLNDWPATHPGVVVLDEPGVGLAPWNFMRFQIDVTRDPPTVDDKPLTFYHFHAFKSFGSRVFDDGLGPYGVMDRTVRQHLYGEYIRDLKRNQAGLQRAIGQTAGTRRGVKVTWRQVVRLARERRLLVSIGDFVVG